MRTCECGQPPTFLAGEFWGVHPPRTALLLSPQPRVTPGAWSPGGGCCAAHRHGGRPSGRPPPGNKSGFLFSRLPRPGRPHFLSCRTRWGEGQSVLACPISAVTAGVDWGGMETPGLLCLQPSEPRAITEGTLRCLPRALAPEGSDTQLGWRPPEQNLSCIPTWGDTCGPLA